MLKASLALAEKWSDFFSLGLAPLDPSPGVRPTVQKRAREGSAARRRGSSGVPGPVGAEASPSSSEATAEFTLRRKLGSLIGFLDLPAIQVWLAASALGLGLGLNQREAALGVWLDAMVVAACLFMYLMGLNDLFDVKIDSLKHSSAALVAGSMSRSEAIATVILTGAVGLVGGYMISEWFFVFTLAIFVVSTLYSAPPVRFKRYYPVSTLGEVLGAYFLFLLGLAVVSSPTSSSLLISVVPTLIAASLRLSHEVKYVDFDRKTGKQTFAVIHGAQNLEVVVKILPFAALALTVAFAALGMLSVPITALTLAFIALPAAVHSTIRASPRLRPISYVWGFVFFAGTAALL